ncbi:tRNA (adenosine(37)-N6)-threonylcarbamoyltransferase complex dimerization subunit type 1 TsaB [Candidatus Saccharibacteria bacterium]|nr:tRNA (adenosine(37)-N6)-threonylcarbamoyltransferase complex dimerization subunit type 1 TsaB [Candidatus Saccharibacteria bacterium]
MILAIEAASPTTKLWLEKDPKATHPTVVWDSGRTLADGLLGQIDNLLKQSQMQLSDLTGIVVFSGPGSFTSLRVGHSVANALADSLKIPVVGQQGDGWLADGLARLAGGSNDQIVLPFYGAEANISKPKA